MTIQGTFKRVLIETKSVDGDYDVDELTNVTQLDIDNYYDKVTGSSGKVIAVHIL